MIHNLFYLVILLIGFPAGLFLSKLCNDEIKSWKGRFIGISVLCLSLAIGVSFTGFEYKSSVILSLFFIIIVNLVIVWKSS